MKHSVLGALVLLAMVISAPVQANGLDAKRVRAFREDFFDWEYALKVWREMPTYAALEAEEKRLASVFEPWYEEFKADPKKALEALKSHPQRATIERGYDLQLAFAHWFDGVYSRWRKGISTRSWKERYSELEAMEVRAKTQGKPCEIKNTLSDCLPWPDWRSPEMKREEIAAGKRPD